MTQLATAATISLLLALAAGASVWIVWSVIENIRATRSDKPSERETRSEPPRQ